MDIRYKQYFKRFNGDRVIVLTTEKVNQMRSNVIRWFPNVASIKLNMILAPKALRNGGGRTPDLPGIIYWKCWSNVVSLNAN